MAVRVLSHAGDFFGFAADVALSLADMWTLGEFAKPWVSLAHDCIEKFLR